MNQLYSNRPKISIVLPCLNEENSILICLESIQSVIQRSNLSAEIIIVDNGSTDNTVNLISSQIIKNKSICFIRSKIKGYGSALMTGFERAQGDFIYMADCDATYNFDEIPQFIEKLEQGYDMVIGNRFTGLMKKNAMPFHKKYIGNPILSFLTRLLFKIKIHDVHCGARAFKKEIYSKLSLHTLGMEFASEMIIKAAKLKIDITEIPVSYGKRIGKTKLNTFTDGWRHLRFLLLYSPLFLFFIPGFLLFSIGLICMTIFYFTNPTLFGFTLYIHPMFLFLAMISIGYQLIFFALFSKIYAITHLQDHDKNFERLFKFFTIEKSLLLGFIFFMIGISLYLSIFIHWVQNDFGALHQIKNSVAALTLIIIGIQTFFSGFMLCTLGIKEK